MYDYSARSSVSIAVESYDPYVNWVSLLKINNFQTSSMNSAIVKESYFLLIPHFECLSIIHVSSNITRAGL